MKVTAYIDGKRVKRVRGRRVARLKLKPPVRKTNFTVRTRPTTRTQRGR